MGFLHGLTAAGRYEKEVKRSKGLQKAALLLKYEGVRITDKTEYSMAYSALVNNFYLSVDSLLRGMGRANVFDVFVNKLQDDEKFRMKQIVIAMSITVGVICATSHRESDAFWNKIIKVISIDDRYKEESKKIYFMAYMWASMGMEPFDPDGGKLAYALLDMDDSDGFPDPSYNTALMTSALAAVRMHRSIGATKILSGESVD